MTRLFKYLKGSMIAILAVLILLVMQAWSDLSLPSLTSDIVNVGIQQNGIDKIAPEAIRQSDMDKVLLFMSNSQKEVFNNNYTLKSKDEVSESEFTTLKDKYDAIQEEAIYIRQDGADMEAIQSALTEPMAVVAALTTEKVEEATGQTYSMGDVLKKQMFANATLPTGLKLEDISIFDLLKTMDEATLAGVRDKILENFKGIEDTMLVPMAATYVATAYEAVGLNLDTVQMQYLVLTGLKMLGLALLSMIAAVLVTLVGARVAAKTSLRMRNDIFQKVVGFSSAETDHFSTASLITRTSNDITQVQMLILMSIRMVIYAPILGIGGIIKVLNTNVSMAWIIALAVVTVLAIVMLLMLVAMPKFNMMQKLVDQLNLVTREILTGLPVIRAFSTEKHEEKRFDLANKTLADNTLFTSRVMVFMMPTMMLIMNAVNIAIIWFGAKGVDSGTIMTGELFAFMAYAMQIIMSFLMLTMVSIILPRSMVAVKRIDEVLSTENAILDPKTSKKLMQPKGVLKFNHVNFSYPNAEEQALVDIDFTANPGQTTAIIGSTGCGKSTLVNLIPRLYDVTSGSITIDGVDIRELTQHDLRENIGFVPQKGILFSGTIDSNLRFGNEEASQELVEKAARIAQATEFIEEKAGKYDSEITQGGSNVSGGQKQRLSIARAIAKEPVIYVFDDSFSALDYKTDVVLRKALKEETGDSTVIIVAQRISTILHADQIIVLDEGKIVGKGTHKELLASSDVYRQIALSQLSQEEIDEDIAAGDRKVSKGVAVYE